MALLSARPRKTESNRRQDLSRSMLVVVMVLLGLAWVGLWARGAWVQLFMGAELNRLASKQYLSAEFERGVRGRILDRKGRVLASGAESKSLYARPLEVAHVDSTARILSRLLDLPVPEVIKKLTTRKNFVWIKRQMEDKVAARIVEAHLPGLYLTTESVRLYPNDQLAGQLLGFVGLDDTGLEGMEKAFNDRLAAKSAEFVVQRDASGRKLYLDAQGQELDTRGQDVTLTIDSHIQNSAEQALAKAVTQNNGKWGVAVVADVETGDILAWANFPFFNPNSFGKVKSGAWRDRAALNTFEPGSTFKPILFAAALQNQVITPSTLFFCENGKWETRGHTIRDTHPLGWLTARGVLVQSSNIGSAKIGLELGVKRYYDALRRLGFGERAGLPTPGESPGILRDPKNWADIDLATGAFGQGIGVTTAQMTRAFLCLANGGVIKQLRLTLDPAVTPDAPQRVFEESVTEQVMEMMTAVVEEDGTGKRARIPGVQVAGKTGTAQKAMHSGGGYGEEYLASFVALVPAKKPKYFFMLLVDGPKPQYLGGLVAAPAVRDIAVETLAYSGMVPEGLQLAAKAPAPSNTPGAAGAAATSETNPNGQAQAQSQAGSDPSLPDLLPVKPLPPAGKTVPDMAGLPVRRAVEVLVEKGIVPVVKGRGMVVARQKPGPGEPWPTGENDVFILWLAGQAG